VRSAAPRQVLGRPAVGPLTTFNGARNRNRIRWSGNRNPPIIPSSVTNNRLVTPLAEAAVGLRVPYDAMVARGSSMGLLMRSALNVGGALMGESLPYASQHEAFLEGGRKAKIDRSVVCSMCRAHAIRVE